MIRNDGNTKYIILAFIMVVLVASNPSIEDHREKVIDQIEERIDDEGGESSIGTQIGQGLGMMMVRNMVKRKNYLLFSTTQIVRDGRVQTIGIGILGMNFLFNGLSEQSQGNNGDDFSTAYVGKELGGGIVGYIFQKGDDGYVMGEVHGIIAAKNDIENVQWGCYGKYVVGTCATIGCGLQNTQTIMKVCPGNTASSLCSKYSSAEHHDWHLPSVNELGKLYENRSSIGGFSERSTYWSSTQENTLNAIAIDFSNGIVARHNGKNSMLSARPIRVF